jgi:Family of unknown function (DUF5677)
MEEFAEITAKYQPAYIERCFSSMAGLHEFSVAFYKDVGNLYDALTRLKNSGRNPTGFSIDDAPILGLLVRISKLVKEVVRYYEQDNAEIICILERPMIEASTIATYLMLNGPDVINDYRKCSYKDRLRILRDLESGSPFYDTKAGKRLLADVREKMDFETDKRRFRCAEVKPMATSGQKLPIDISRDRARRSLLPYLRHDVGIDPRFVE